jgi:hypothetical protein
MIIKINAGESPAFKNHQPRFKDPIDDRPGPGAYNSASKAPLR